MLFTEIYWRVQKSQVSKRQFSKRPVSKRLKRQVYKTCLQNVMFTKRQVYKMSGLQNIRSPNVRLQKNIHIYSIYLWLLEIRMYWSFYIYGRFKAKRFETRRFETWRIVNLTFCKPNVLKPDVLKPDVLKPYILKPDVLWVDHFKTILPWFG